MNKMAKGAIATAAGVVLLIGGGGTLAVWNVERESGAGQITAGDLNLTTEAGSWTVLGVDGPEEILNIADYKIVPGDVLTYTQLMDVTLDGDNLAANLTVTSPSGSNKDFVADTFEVSEVRLTKGTAEIQNPLTDDVTDVVATASFEFKESTGGRLSRNATYNFDTVAFKLEQIAPAPTDASAAPTS
ncbi:alternate-type signal peptide domain-containing protein [uncultured Arthrobacter sp.]|uniref:alternate-type signal peptide domain-containing protein n=1 Tax=uncultured Arthrobacter sp. TaxID=114050 RepID=UPI0026336B87|nr:alternate-type signal peptide domain-containing protein [uncultured Arthrobacter sp.]